MEKKRKKIIFVVAFIIYSIALYTFASNPTGLISHRTNDRYLARFIENYNILKENWYFFPGSQEAIEAATEALTSSNLDNDHYTSYIPAAYSGAFAERMTSQYIGIGIQFIGAGEYPLVSRVFEGSPAQAVDMQVGDFIIRVDGTDVSNKATDEVREIVVGEAGDDREIVVLRDNEEVTLNITLATIDSSVHFSMIDSNGHLVIADFTQTTSAEVAQALQYFDENNAERIIIDLRNNPGGQLSALEEIADQFLPRDQIIMSARDRSGTTQHIRTISSDYFDGDVVVLVNESSASAAEALTAALQENLDIPVYGQTTFGKGIMQSFFQFDDGAQLMYTSAEWLTPDGSSINREGITPTNPIDATPLSLAADFRYSFEDDIKYDTVSEDLVFYQRALRALGYNVDRIDGYYSSRTRAAIEEFKRDFNLTNETDLSIRVQAKIVSRVVIENNKLENDDVLNAALR